MNGNWSYPVRPGLLRHPLDRVVAVADVEAEDGEAVRFRRDPRDFLVETFRTVVHSAARSSRVALCDVVREAAVEFPYPSVNEIHPCVCGVAALKVVAFEHLTELSPLRPPCVRHSLSSKSRSAHQRPLYCIHIPAGFLRGLFVLDHLIERARNLVLGLQEDVHELL